MNESLENAIERISKLTRGQRIGICVGVVALLVGVMTYFVFMPKYQKLEELTAEEQKLQMELAEAKKRARQLSKLQKEMKEVEGEYRKATRALPESEEIPNLLTSISRSGQDAGLEVLLFEPEKEVRMGFYAEIPVSMTVTGRYHEAVDFFNRIAQLSRIVNLKDVTMKADPSQKSRDGATSSPYKLEISSSAVTYKFVENTEGAAESK